MWILESSKQVFNEEEINEIHQKVNDFFNQSYDESNQDFKKNILFWILLMGYIELFT